MTPNQTTGLAVMHGTIACLAGGASVAVGVVWPGLGRVAPDESLRAPAMAVLAAAVCYLAVTAWTEWRCSRRLRAGQRTPPTSLWPLMGHVWVLMVAGACLARGPASRAHLVGFDRAVAALATISLLCALALIVPWCWQFSVRGAAQLKSDAPAENEERCCPWLQLLAAVLLVLSLWWLESRPWKTRDDASAAASSIQAV